MRCRCPRVVDRSIVERKTRLDGTQQEYVCEGLVVEPGKRAVLRYVIDRARLVGDIELQPGVVTIAHYWVDRPYNAYHWIEGTRTVGLYISIADRTVIEATSVAYRDLVVDALLRPSGAVDILDEDELPSDLEPGARKTIADALEALITDRKP